MILKSGSSPSRSLIMEAEVFQRFKPQLALAISDSVLSIAGKCQACGLINEAYDEVMRQDLTSKVKARLVLNTVEKCIVTDAANYKKFVDILSEEVPTTCKKPLSEMSEELKNLRDRKKVRHCTETNMTKGSIVDVPISTSSGGLMVSKKSKQMHRKDSKGRSGLNKSFSHSISTDSGISIDRSDSLVSQKGGEALTKLISLSEEESPPFQETPLDDEKSKVAESTRISSTTQSLVCSDMIERVKGIERDARSLQYDIMQKEAVEASLRNDIKSFKDDINRLREELKKAVGDKNKAKEALDSKQSEIRQLKRDMEIKEEDIDRLKTQLSASEASAEKLQGRVGSYQRQIKSCNEVNYRYEQDIQALEFEVADLKAKVDQKQKVVNNLRHRICQMEQKNMLTALEYRRSVSEEYKKKVEELHEREAKITARVEEVDARDHEIAVKEDDLNCYKKKLTFSCFVLALVVALIAVAAYYYRDTECIL